MESRGRWSLLLTLASIPLAIAMALAIAKAGAAQTPMTRCAELVGSKPATGPESSAEPRRTAYRRCLADPVAFAH